MTKTKQKILCVDDEIINLDLFKLAFEDDYEVLIAETPYLGIELVKEHKIKVVISDYKMPEMDGITFIKGVKKLNPNISCILMTAFVENAKFDKEDVDNLLFGYILKPWTYEEVKSTIENAFAGKNQYIF